MIKHIKENEFSQVINNDLVLVDFYAEWCGPCKMLGPVLEELSNQRSLDVYKINVDEIDDLAKSLGIMSIPTLLIFKDGKLLESKTGFMPEIEIQNWIQSVN